MIRIFFPAAAAGPVVRGTPAAHQEGSVVQKPPPPLLGFNNNVRHRGKVFHIQTEDSGMKHARITTHLFADGGRIVDSTRLDYSEHVGREDIAEVLRLLMKEQHKAMFVRLRAGTLDARIEAACGPLPLPPAAPPTVAVPLDREAGARRAGAPPASEADVARLPQAPGRTATGSSSPRLPAAGLEGAGGAGAAAAPTSVARAAPLVDAQAGEPFAVEEAAASPPDAEAGEDAEGTGEEARYAQPRPASIFGEMPPLGNSLFGERMISEQSLDEVILSYLAEDLEGTNE